MAVTATNAGNRTNKKLTFKNKAQFRSCTLKINNTFKDNVEHLDIVIPMDKLLEQYSGNYSMTLGSC